MWGGGGGKSNNEMITHRVPHFAGSWWDGLGDGWGGAAMMLREG